MFIQRIYGVSNNMIFGWLKVIIEELINLIYPRRCPICDNVLQSQGILCCEECKGKLKYVKEPFCMKCGKPVENDNVEYCFDCSKKEKHFKSGRAVFIYDKCMKNSIAGFKYKGKREYGEFYGNEIVKYLGDYINSLDVDVIIPVPIHKERYKTRGYNQADVIAKYVGKKLNIPVISNALIRKVNTVAQKKLDNKQRNKNLANAFEVNLKDSELENINKVLIIDDIYTTGATIDSCAKSLIGKKKIEVYFVTLSIGQGK